MKSLLATICLIFLFGCTKKAERPDLSRSELLIKHGYTIGRGGFGKGWNPPLCEEVYRGVYIDCRPTNPKLIGEYVQHIKSAEELRIGCREYIDRTYPGKGPIESELKMGCHQMTGGPLVINGGGQLAPRPGREE